MAFCPAIFGGITVTESWAFTSNGQSKMVAKEKSFTSFIGFLQSGSLSG
jgi:hypothetical protein